MGWQNLFGPKVLVGNNLLTKHMNYGTLHISVRSALITHPDPIADAANAAPAVAHDQGGDADVQLYPVEDDSAEVLGAERDF